MNISVWPYVPRSMVYFLTGIFFLMAMSCDPVFDPDDPKQVLDYCQEIASRHRQIEWHDGFTLDGDLSERNVKLYYFGGNGRSQATFANIGGSYATYAFFGFNGGLNNYNSTHITNAVDDISSSDIVVVASFSHGFDAAKAFTRVLHERRSRTADYFLSADPVRGGIYLHNHGTLATTASRTRDKNRLNFYQTNSRDSAIMGIAPNDTLNIQMNFACNKMELDLDLVYNVVTAENINGCHVAMEYYFEEMLTRDIRTCVKKNDATDCLADSFRESYEANSKENSNNDALSCS